MPSGSTTWVVLLASCLLAAACSLVPGAPESHPLAGRIWDPAAQRFVTEAVALDRLAGPGIVLLGETHDNPEHHEIQLRVLQRIAERGGAAAVAFEQIDAERQPALDALREGDGAAVGVAGAVDKGWKWPLYEPLASFARAQGWRIVAANLSRARAREVARQGLRALGAGQAERLALDRTDSPERRKAMRDELLASHCGQDDPLIDRLVDAQRARDAAIADRLLAADRPTVAAILGRGHARRDLAVPLYLAQRAPGSRVVSLGLVEVDEGRAPADYPEAAPGVHDLAWFTSRAPREDPCKDFPGVKPGASSPAP